MNTILVGFDDSEIGQPALRFAIEEAKLRKAKLRVMTTWKVPDESSAELPASEEILKRYRKEAEDTLAEAAAIVKREAPGVEIDVVAIEGKLGDALAEAAEAAPKPTMVVVGTHGRGGLTGSLLGSVSHQLIGQSHIPVVVVPSPQSSD